MSQSPSLPSPMMPRQAEPEAIGFTDIVELPSKGIFYPHKKSEVIVELMTALDENILTSYSLIKNNTQFDMLLKAKIKDPDFVVDDLLRGDKDMILLHLRCTSYGTEFPVSVFDPTEGEKIETTVDLSRIGMKEMVAHPDEDLMFHFTLPITKQLVRFRLLTDREETNLTRTTEAKAKRFGGVSHSVTDRLKAQIMELGGVTDKLKISGMVDKLPVKDSYELRLFMHEVEPGLDTSYEFVSPTTGETFRGEVTFGPRLFYPSLKL